MDSGSNPVLHDDIVRAILTWVPTKSLMRFKCVSKCWLSIIVDPSFARVFRGGFRGLLISEPYFWKKASRREFYYLSLSGGRVKYLSHHLTLDHGRKKMGCTDVVNGLLCFYYSNYSFLYNIATRECRRLPLSTYEADSCSYHLGFDPVSKLFKLLKICPIYNHYNDDEEYPEEESEFVRNLKCEILTLGIDSSWRTIISAPEEIKSRSVCLNGNLYWNESDGTSNSDNHFIAFHLGEEKFQLIPSPEPEPYCLMEFGPGLALVSGRCYPYSNEAVICYGHGGESVVWTEQKFVHPRSRRRENRPVGVLPDGKVVVIDDEEINRLSKFYIYDPSEGNLEKYIIWRSFSSSFSKREGISGYRSYHEENIISLSCLTACP